MAKRFIDTDLFRKPLMRSLEAPYKALWMYLLCECDHAGIWDVELDVAAMRLGMKLDPEKVVDKFGGAVIPVDGGAKWYLVGFVEFQYGTLNPANRVHASVIALLEKYGIDLNSSSQNKPLTSPLQGAKDKEKDKDNSEGKERAGAKPKLFPIVWPKWAGENTLRAWEAFKIYRQVEHKARYKSADTEQKAVNILASYFKSGAACVAALEHATGKNWRFPVDPAEYSYPKAEGMPVEQAVWNPRA